MTRLFDMTKILAFVAVAALVGGCGDDGNGGTADARPGTADAAPSADAGTAFTKTVAMSNANEPASACTGTPGATATGSTVVTITPDNTMVTVTVTYSNLSGAANNAHIHYGAPGATGNPVLVFTSFTSPIMKTFTSADYTAVAGAPTTFAGFITALKAGGSFYSNVHTVACPGGEIRGNL